MAVVKKNLVSKFSPLLKEGECRTITNFGVGQNLGSYRSTKHQYKFFFFQTTAVRMCEDLGIPLHGFSFVPSNDIITKSLDDAYLIGKLSPYYYFTKNISKSIEYHHLKISYLS